MDKLLYRLVDDGGVTMLRQYHVTKETKWGKWIYDMWHEKRRFVLNNSAKRFAHDSVENAVNSYIYRKKFQLRIYKRRVEILEETIDAFTNSREETVADLVKSGWFQLMEATI